jgi:hypothetical protein
MLVGLQVRLRLRLVEKLLFGGDLVLGGWLFREFMFG